MSEENKLPENLTFEQLTEFWDSHSLADFWIQTEAAHITVDPQLEQHHLIQVEPILLEKLTKIADQRGVTVEQLIHLFLENQLNSAKS